MKITSLVERSKRNFCSVCGKTGEVLIESKCKDCFLREKELVKLPESLEVKLCKNCLSYFKKNRWSYVSGDLEEVLQEASFSAIENSMKLVKDASAKISLQDIKKSSETVYLVSCSVKVEGEIFGAEYRSEKNVEVRARLELCDNCSRQIGGYYESILQIRSEDALGRAERKEIQALVDRSISFLAQKDRKAFLSDFKTMKEGMDFHVGSTKVARKLAEILREKFGGEISESPKLFGKNEHGKDLYRVTIALRLPRLKEGDIIEFETQPLQLLGFAKEKAIAFDLQSRKRLAIPIKNLKRAKILGRRKDVVRATVSEVIPGRVQVIELRDYKTLYFKTNIPLRVKDEVEIFRNYLLKTNRE
ncbi:MAG: NMD3-related protein [Methanobacteriota archaeon]